MRLKKMGARIRSYLGHDCYGYSIHCENCDELITGFSPQETDANWVKHTCKGGPNG